MPQSRAIKIVETLKYLEAMECKARNSEVLQRNVRVPLYKYSRHTKILTTRFYLFFFFFLNSLKKKFFFIFFLYSGLYRINLFHYILPIVLHYMSFIRLHLFTYKIIFCICNKISDKQ